MAPLAGRTVIALYPIAPQNRGRGIAKIAAKLIVEINLKTFFVYTRDKFGCVTVSVN